MTSVAEVLDLAAHGLRVFPIRGKVPLVDSWPTRASADAFVVRQLFESRPEATGVGVACGASAFGTLLVLDVDVAKHGFESLDALIAKHGPLPRTWCVITGTGGVHYYFTAPAGLRNTASRIAPGLDTRAEGGYVAAPPSIHPNGNPYHWAPDLSPAQIKAPAAAPAWLLAEAAPKPAPKPAPRTPLRVVGSGVLERARRYVAAMPPAISGQGGHEATFRVALALVRGFALPESDALDVLREFNERCEPAWSEKELAHKIASASRDGTVPMGYLLTDERAPLPTRTSTPAPADEPAPAPRVAPALFDLPTLPAFPTDALPDWMREQVEAISAETETAPDLAAMVGLAALATACARRIEVEPRPGYVETLNLYLLVVLPSGNRKSSVFRAMSRPIVEAERELVEAARASVSLAQHDREILERRIDSLKKKLAAIDSPDDQRELRLELEQTTGELARMPPAVLPHLLASDVTTEKLTMLLADHGRISVLDDEGGLFETMAGRYSSGGGSNIDTYLKGHDGGTLRVDRVGRPGVHAERPALTIGMTVQPDVLRGLGDKSGFRSRGFTARFLYSLPQSRVGVRELGTVAADSGVVARYSTSLRTLLAVPDQPVPLKIVFSPEAYAAWLAYARAIEPRRAPRGDLGPLADWASKFDGAVARLAGLLHAAEFPSAPWITPVSAKTVRQACAIGDYLVEHAKAAHGELGMDPVADRGRRIVEWLRARDLREFAPRDLLKSNVAGVQDRKSLDPVLELLTDRGILVPIAPPPVGLQGGRPRVTAYVVAEEVFA